MGGKPLENVVGPPLATTFVIQFRAESDMNRHNPYVRTDEHGVMRVAGTHVMLDSVLAAFEQGHSPETIRSRSIRR
jgi:hypothetical protein